MKWRKGNYGKGKRRVKKVYREIYANYIIYCIRMSL